MSMDALPSELVKHILSFDLGTTFAVASRVNRTWKQLALSQLSSITSLTISYGAPGNFAGVIELDASFTQDEDEVGCEEWFGEHVRIIMKELRM